MRQALWSDADFAELECDLPRYAGRDDYLILIAESEAGEAVGFAEIGTRSVVEGHDRAAAYLEGIWIAPDHRRRGISRLLLAAGQAWGEARGFDHFGSDALIDNQASHRWHVAVGFEEIERIVIFGKALRSHA